MNLSQISLFLGTFIASTIGSAFGLHCYNCHSSDAGCGKELNIRLQRWTSCASPGYGGGENFCVKVIEKREGETYITRDCLMTLKRHSLHRMKMPTVQRHGYCSPARNDDPGLPLDKNTIYCFCNDWNGCNPASNIKAKLTVTSTLGLLSALLIRYFL